MCGGFPCNCCKPRLAIDTHFDVADVPWKCFFRNRSSGGGYGDPSGGYKRTDASVRPILDWPCDTSYLKIPSLSTSSGHYQELLIDMKHPFDAEGGDGLEATYTILVDTETPTSRRFGEFWIRFEECMEADPSWYGGTIPGTVKAVNVMTWRNEMSTFDNKTSGFMSSNANAFFGVSGGTWQTKPTGGTTNANVTGSNLFELTVQRTSTDYVFTGTINGVLQTFGKSGFSDTTSPQFPLVSTPRANQWIVPRPWKHYRINIRSLVYADTDPYSPFSYTPLWYDRVAISSSL